MRMVPKRSRGPCRETITERVPGSDGILRDKVRSIGPKGVFKLLAVPVDRRAGNDYAVRDVDLHHISKVDFDQRADGRVVVRQELCCCIEFAG